MKRVTKQIEQYPDRAITVWEFRSVDGKQVVRAIRPWHPDDTKFVHEYQRIVFRGMSRDYPNTTA